MADTGTPGRRRTASVNRIIGSIGPSEPFEERDPDGPSTEPPPVIRKANRCYEDIE
jgi:hypothetical protein